MTWTKAGRRAGTRAGTRTEKVLYLLSIWQVIIVTVAGVLGGETSTGTLRLKVSRRSSS